MRKRCQMCYGGQFQQVSCTTAFEQTQAQTKVQADHQPFGSEWQEVAQGNCYLEPPALAHFLLLVIKSIRDAVEELLRVCHSLGHLIARGLLLDDGCLVGRGQVQRVLVVRGDLYVLLGTLLQALPSSLRVPRATVAVEKADHTQNQPVELHVVQGQLAVVPGPVAHVTDDEGIHLLTAQKMRSRPPVAALV